MEVGKIHTGMTAVKRICSWFKVHTVITYEKGLLYEGTREGGREITPSHSHTQNHKQSVFFSVSVAAAGWCHVDGGPQGSLW